MNRDALVVGINYYAQSQARCLEAPVNDARAIADILKQQGDFRVKPLLGTDAQHLVNRQTLSAELKKLFNPDSKQAPDTALFYFSGHGFEGEDLVKEVCLATSDTKSNASGAGIRLKALRELLIASPVKQQIVWLDCCHSGAILNFQEGNPRREGQVRDRCFIAASRDFGIAYGGRGKDYSLLTQALLKGLMQPGSGWLNSTDLLGFLRRELGSSPQQLMAEDSGSGIALVRYSSCPNSQTPHSTSDTDAREERKQRDLQAERDRQEQREQAAYQDYLKQMSLLFIDRKISLPSANSEAFQVAQALTADILRSVGAERRNNIIAFLNSLKLTETSTAEDIKSRSLLSGIQLSNAELRNLQAPHANFAQAHLIRTDLRGAILRGANLEGAYLEKSVLTGAYLEQVYLYGAYLNGAYLEGAYLVGANLVTANLRRAKLIGARLEGANLEGANLENANLRGANLDGVCFVDTVFRNTTMPNGTVRDS